MNAITEAIAILEREPYTNRISEALAVLRAAQSQPSEQPQTAGRQAAETKARLAKL